VDVASSSGLGYRCPDVNGIVEHFKKKREQAFANHAAGGLRKNKMLLGLVEACQRTFLLA